jgi:hypothetical protein
MANKIERRRLRFDDFQAVNREVDQLLAHGYTRLSNWSLGQMCEHLAIVLERAVDGFPSMLPAPVRWIIRWVALKKILRHEQMSRSITAPKYMMPGDAVEDRDGVERLKAAILRFQAHTGPYHPSPAFGELSNNEWRDTQLWHAEHHLSYLHPRSAKS